MKHSRRRRKCEQALSAADLVSKFLAAHPKGAADDLVELWRHWEMVMGPELAGLAHPLGTRAGTLLVGADDNLILQELAFLTPEILERANAFLDNTRFTNVQASLMQGRASLENAPALAADAQKQQTAPPSTPVSRPAPGPLGKLTLDPASPLGRAYWKYVERFGKQG